MPNPTLNRRVLTSGASSISYDVDAIAYFNQLSPAPSDFYKNAINTLILKLKSDGNWNGLDRLWIHATEAQQNATISVKYPTSAALVEVGSPAPTWTVSQGYTGVSGNSSLSLSYVPSVDKVNLSLNSAAMGVYARVTEVNDLSIILGANTTGVGEMTMALNYTGFGKLIAINAIGQDIIANTTTQGFYALSRSASNLTTLYKNGASLGTSVAVSTALPTFSLCCLGWNSDGVIGNRSTNQVAITFVSNSTVNQATFYTALQAFATTIGFNV